MSVFHLSREICTWKIKVRDRVDTCLFLLDEQETNEWESVITVKNS